MDLNFDNFKNLVISDDINIDNERDVSEFVIDYIKSRRDLPDEEALKKINENNDNNNKNIEINDDNKDNGENKENEENKENKENEENYLNNVRINSKNNNNTQLNLSRESEKNETPIKNKDNIKINPVKLLGDFKKKYTKLKIIIICHIVLVLTKINQIILIRKI